MLTIDPKVQKVIDLLQAQCPNIVVRVASPTKIVITATSPPPPETDMSVCMCVAFFHKHGFEVYCNIRRECKQDPPRLEITLADYERCCS
jgi:hypothetical protein